MTGKRKRKHKKQKLEHDINELDLPNNPSIQTEIESANEAIDEIIIDDPLVPTSESTNDLYSFSDNEITPPEFSDEETPPGASFYLEPTQDNVILAIWKHIFSNMDDEISHEMLSDAKQAKRTTTVAIKYWTSDWPQKNKKQYHVLINWFNKQLKIAKVPEPVWKVIRETFMLAKDMKLKQAMLSEKISDDLPIVITGTSQKSSKSEMMPSSYKQHDVTAGNSFKNSSKYGKEIMTDRSELVTSSVFARLVKLEAGRPEIRMDVKDIEEHANMSKIIHLNQFADLANPNDRI
jgi:hypothetical protein